MNANDEKQNNAKHETPSRVEEFIDAVEKKTDNEIHRRILGACKKENPASCVEEELKKVIEEILK